MVVKRLSLRAANAGNPVRGLERIWERLEDRYASPELVHASLQKKLAQFPKLTAKDYKGLYDLADIIAEIESVKENPKYRTLFAYYVDPPVGWGSTYCFTDVRVSVGVGVGVSVGVGVGVHVTPITKRTPAQIFFGRHVFCSPGHWLLIFAMTLTFALKVKP